MTVQKSKKRLLTGKVFNIEEVELENEKGQEFTHQYVSSPNVVLMLPYNSKTNKIYLIDEYRTGPNTQFLSVPAGKIDPGEKPETAAKRELEEEIAKITTKIELVAEGFSSPGILDEYFYGYITEVRDCKEGEQQHFLDEHETLKLVEVSIDKAKELLKTNQIPCVRSQLLLRIFFERFN